MDSSAIFAFREDDKLDTRMRKDMEDIHEMRFKGPTCAAFETRWALIHVDELILDAEEGTAPSVLMHRVTDHFWKRFAYDVNANFEMFGFVMWRTRKEKVYARDDPVRKVRYRGHDSEFASVEIPFVVPFGQVQFVPRIDEKFREVVVPLDDNGKERRDVYVSYARRGGLRVRSRSFETECGAVLDEWRRYTQLVRLHDAVVTQNARLMPYVEHVPLNEQARMNDEARAVEALLHPAETDEHGYEVPQQAVLRKVERAPEAPVQSFVEIPNDRRLSSVQPLSSMTLDMETLHNRFLALLASTLQIPQRHLKAVQGSHAVPGAASAAVVEDELVRAIRAAGERRNEIVDVLAEAFAHIYGVRPQNTHLPTASQLSPPLLFEMSERGYMGDSVVKEELSTLLGMKRTRFTL